MDNLDGLVIRGCIERELQELEAVHGHAQSPNVKRFATDNLRLMSLKGLWGQEELSSGDLSYFYIATEKGNPEVCEFDIVVVVEEYVLRLNIAMDDVVLMH